MITLSIAPWLLGYMAVSSLLVLAAGITAAFYHIAKIAGGGK